MLTMTLPESLGRLRRVDRIGAGGFASVWRYQDDELDSPVAVKALADNWAQRVDVRERFLEEARILRRADSDHIVRVYDLGEVDQTPYFVMTYASRGTLADLLEAGQPMDPARVVELIHQISLGLDVLHRTGVIHRDIKPQNLLLDVNSDGGLKVLVADLGVAKASLHASGLTEVVGTPAYMAPEQATGTGIDQRADVHALAAVAYQMLTGRYAREGLEAVATGALPPPPSELAELPGAVDTVVLRGLDSNPELRWPGALEFADALRSAVESPVEPIDAPPHRADWTSSISRLVLITATVLVLAFGGSFLLVSLLL